VTTEHDDARAFEAIHAILRPAAEDIGEFDPTITWSDLAKTDLGFPCYIGRSDHEDYYVVMRDVIPMQTEVFIVSPRKPEAETTLGLYPHASPTIALAVELGQRLCEMQLKFLVKNDSEPLPAALDF
jgi:hypothetical protein